MRYAAAYGTSDIVFNTKTGLWACCYGAGVQDCAHPIDITFQAPSPNDLKGTFQAPLPEEEPEYSSTSQAVSSTSISSSSSVTSAATPISTSATKSTSTSCADTGSCPSGLSEAAKAGIGVGATIAALILTAILFLLVRGLRRRKQTVHSPATVPSRKAADETPGAAPMQELYARQQAELDSWARHEAETVNRGRSYEVA
ncbi:MAG: hypothetical protein Q9200_004799 [Gallowayella weberi]